MIENGPYACPERSRRIYEAAPHSVPVFVEVMVRLGSPQVAGLVHTLGTLGWYPIRYFPGRFTRLLADDRNGNSNGNGDGGGDDKSQKQEA